mmetsp:Transcript_1518/g.2459  ORF Transcript_1518/g.2459 Transcript_1518/m.2459 type:complete len:108 (+) Transcript_1518:2052-2375(+)
MQLHTEASDLKLERSLLNNSIEQVSQSLENATRDNLKMRDDYEREKVLTRTEHAALHAKIRSLESGHYSSQSPPHQTSLPPTSSLPPMSRSSSLSLLEEDVKEIFPA